MLLQVNNPLLLQIRKKTNNVFYAVNTDYNSDSAFALSMVRNIVEKREHNSNYPYPGLSYDQINFIIKKYI